MPWRQARKALGIRSLGSAVSEEVSELVWMQRKPRSRATSWTANAPDEASASSRISQPSLLTSSRATRAASCGWPFESRTTISIFRPARPPARQRDLPANGCPAPARPSAAKVERRVELSG